MPSFNVQLGHHLAREEALERIMGLLASIKQHQSQDQNGVQIVDLHESWSGFAGCFVFGAGCAVSGAIEVGVSEVKISVQLPLATESVKDKIEQLVLGHTRLLLT